MKRQQFKVELTVSVPVSEEWDETDVRYFVEDSVRHEAGTFLPTADVAPRVDGVEVQAWDEVDEPSLSAEDRNPSMVGQS